MFGCCSKKTKGSGPTWGNSAYRWRVEVERNKPYCKPRSAGVGRRNSRSNCGRKRDISWRSSRRIQRLGRCRPPRRNGGDSTKSRLSAGPAARLREGVGRRPIAAKSAPEFRNSWPKRSGSASRPTWTCKWIERERKKRMSERQWPPDKLNDFQHHKKKQVPVLIRRPDTNLHIFCRRGDRMANFVLLGSKRRPSKMDLINVQSYFVVPPPKRVGPRIRNR